jgi:hypothetical protein
MAPVRSRASDLCLSLSARAGPAMHTASAAQHRDLRTLTGVREDESSGHGPPIGDRSFERIFVSPLVEQNRAASPSWRGRLPKAHFPQSTLLNFSTPGSRHPTGSLTVGAWQRRSERYGGAHRSSTCKPVAITTGSARTTFGVVNVGPVRTVRLKGSCKLRETGKRCAPQKCRPAGATTDFSTWAVCVIRFSGPYSIRERRRRLDGVLVVHCLRLLLRCRTPAGWILAGHRQGQDRPRASPRASPPMHHEDQRLPTATTGKERTAARGLRFIQGLVGNLRRPWGIQRFQPSDEESPTAIKFGDVFCNIGFTVGTRTASNIRRGFIATTKSGTLANVPIQVDGRPRPATLA